MSDEVLSVMLSVETALTDVGDKCTLLMTPAIVKQTQQADAEREDSELPPDSAPSVSLLADKSCSKCFPDMEQEAVVYCKTCDLPLCEEHKKVHSYNTNHQYLRGVAPALIGLHQSMMSLDLPPLRFYVV